MPETSTGWPSAAASEADICRWYRLMLMSGGSTSAAISRRRNEMAMSRGRRRGRLARTGSDTDAESGSADPSCIGMDLRRIKSMHHVEGSAPAGLIEEVQQHVAHLLHAIAHADVLFIFLGRDERPVDKEWASDDVLARHKAPEAAIETVQPVVAHGEVFARRHHQVTVLDVAGQLIGPDGFDVLSLRGGHVGKFVAIGQVTAVVGMPGLGLVLPLTVEVDITLM